MPAWQPVRTPLGRLTGQQRHLLVDPSLAARLLGVGAEQLVRGADGGLAMPRDGNLLGALFESLVAQSVRVYAQAAEARVSHLRTKGGAHEIDLIVQRPDGRILAIEVKLASIVNDDRDVRHLRWLSDRLGWDVLDLVVVTTGRHAFRRADGVAVVPAALLGP